MRMSLPSRVPRLEKRDHLLFALVVIAALTMLFASALFFASATMPQTLEATDV